MENEKQSVFDTLNKVKLKVEKKGKFNYVSWTNAWKAIKQHYPNANFKVYENDKGYPAFIGGDVGSFVKVGVTINDLEHIEHYPILDNYNKTIPRERLNSFDINKSIKRALVKCLAYFGLGLYVYEGEDLEE